MSKKDHARHNEDVCSLLLDQGSYNDWAITTAFYAALHYVQHEMFPRTEVSIEYPTFETYYNRFKFGGRKPAKHTVTLSLILDLMPKLYESYKFLFDNCMMARYHRYKMPDPVTKKAIEHLKKIKGGLKK